MLSPARSFGAIVVFYSWAWLLQWQCWWVEANKLGINFLDMSLTTVGSMIVTKPYTKPTDRKLYIRMDSCHPIHQKNSIAYSQALRLKIICSNNADYIAETKVLKENLVKRGYDPKIITSHLNKAATIPRWSLLTQRPKRTPQADNTINLIVTYRQGIFNILRIIQDLKTKHKTTFDCRIACRKKRAYKTY